MTVLYYKVAHHLFAIVTPNEEATIALLDSYGSFRVVPEAGEKPVFTLHLETQPLQYDLPDYVDFDWDESHCYVKRDEKQYAFEIRMPQEQIQHTLLCATDFSEGYLLFAPDMPSFSYAFGNVLMILYAFSTAPQHTLMLHASVAMKDGKGYLFQGKSGTGKSTHSRLWLQNITGAELLNDDNPVVRVMNNEVRVFGTPWSGKTPCYRNLNMPVGAFVRIIRAPQNQIKRHSIVEAFASLYPSASAMKWDKRVHDAICKTVSDVIVCTPSYALQCLPNEEAAHLCAETVTKEA